MSVAGFDIERVAGINFLDVIIADILVISRGDNIIENTRIRMSKGAYILNKVRYILNKKDMHELSTGVYKFKEVT